MDNDPKRHIRGIISGQIQERKSNLDQVKAYIEQDFQKSLSPSDSAYIERKYIKYCSNFWLTEITDTLRELTDNKSTDTIRVVFSSLDNINSLSDVPDLFKRREYYQLLIQHSRLVSKEDETTLISRFKKECLEQTVAYSETAEKELQFLKAIVDCLNASQNLRSIITELKLKDFCRGGLSFAELLRRIIHLEENTCGESLTALKEAAECLQQETDLFLIDKFVKVISAYIKPIEINERRIDNRLVIEVKGRNVVISEILQQIENKLSANSDIEEVHFLGADVYIDANFTDRIWHGQNIAISTKAMKICNKVTWNVSGRDNDQIYSGNAGTGEDGHGKRGTDGCAGESGGNVFVLAEKIVNPGNFTIISNGGMGGNGQDGGNGEDGKDGKGISKTDFDKKFPPVASFMRPRMTQIIKVIDSIIEDYSEIKQFWYTGTGTTIGAIAGDIREQIEYAARMGDLDTDVAPSYDVIPVDFKESVFIEAMTREGNEITFSFECGGWVTSCQAFLLYKGSFGQPGGHPGECGLGGDGGYAGEIIVRNPRNSGQNFGITTNARRGKDGEKGRSGKCGSHGRNGLDMGYLDHAWWTKVEFRDRGKYKVEYYDRDNSPSDRVWCPKNSKYAGIVPASNEHRGQRKYEERKSTEHREHRAQAVRKKNISQNSISTNYTNSFSSKEEDILQNLSSDLDSTKQQALRAITENQEQLQEKQTKELGVKRCVNFTSQKT